MANTLTNYYSFIKPQPQGDQNQWGIHLNTDLDSIDTAINNAAFGLSPGQSTLSVSAVNVNLTNPLKSFYSFSFSATGKSLILPVMNAPATNSPIAGAAFRFYNYGSNPASILAQDGSTVVVPVILPGQLCLVRLTANGTANGNFTVSFELPRQPLQGTLNLYVRTDGSDSNNGMVNSAAGAFLTIQKAIDTVTNNYDLNGKTVNINVIAGTYAAGITLLGPWVGQGTVNLIGDTTTPSNVVISVTSNNCIRARYGATLNVAGFKLTAATSGDALLVDHKAYVNLNGLMEFGAVNASWLQIAAQDGGIIDINASYTISGGGAVHYWCTSLGEINVNAAITVTTSGTPAFNQFANAATLGYLNASNITFAGTGATGTRYANASNSVINTNGGGANYFPGNAAGGSTTGGQYL